jgi:hypothetical protein
MLRRLALALVAALLIRATPASAEDFCWITFHAGYSYWWLNLLVYVNYEDAPGDFVGSSVDAACETLAEDVTLDPDDNEDIRLLSAFALAGPFDQSLEGPRDVMRCKWTPTSRVPEPADFDLSDSVALNGAFILVDAEMTISNIDCSGVVLPSTTTTTTSGPTTTSTTSTLPEAVCGDYDGNAKVLVSDALGVLRTAVGSSECDACHCDVTGDGSVSIADALATLKLAVGTEVPTLCPGC